MTITATGIVQNQTASAYTCPSGQEYHETDNACWTKETRAPQRGTSCAANYDYDSTAKTCVRYTRTSNQPTNDDGSAASFSCPDGQEYHSTDNKCYLTKSPTRGTSCPAGYGGYNADTKKCYQETDDNPTISPGEKPTEDQKKAARDRVFADCKAAGGTDDECNKQADDARKKCENDANYSECMKKQNNIENGECEDGSTPNASTGKCANGEEPKTAGQDGTGKNCGEAETVLIQCEEEGVEAIGSVLRIAVTVLTVLIGIAAVGGLAWAAILYAKAEDSEGNTKESKELIRNIVIGLFLYGFLIAIINWLVPGGVIG